MTSDPNATEINVRAFLRPVLPGLGEDELEELARSAVIRTFPMGAEICREGEPGKAVYFIVEGSAGVYKRLTAERERYLNKLESGELFGEIAVLQEGIRQATVRVEEPTTVLEIDEDTFLDILERSPSLSVRILVGLSSRLSQADQQAIADLRRANQELTRTLRRLERLDQTKSDFIRVSAHELRTPVAALKGYAQMISNHPLVEENADIQALVDGITSSTRRLQRIFDSILDLSWVMTESLKITYHPVSMPMIFRSIRRDFRKALADRDLILDTDGIGSLPMCMGEPSLLYKAFYHLVNNAIKFTPDGGSITVTGDVVETDMGRCFEIVVADAGVGIKAEDLDLIFEKFYRTGEVSLHSSGTTKFKGGGPGLGLAIARGIVVAHGGRIWAESPGYDEETCPGSRFIVQLPLAEFDPMEENDAG